MTLVIAYLLAFIGALALLWSFEALNQLPFWLKSYSLAYQCLLAGGLGGAVYCLRAVYINRSVHDRWNPKWTVWYFLRPIVSCLVGLAAYIFLNAGLMVLDASQETGTNTYGFLALAFVAGLNVDRFLVRIEETARSTWGIRPSRTSDASTSQGVNSGAKDKGGT